MNRLDNKKGTEQDILERAVQTVGRETGLRLKLVEWEARHGDQRGEAVVTLEPGKQTFTAEVKKWAQHVNLGALINQIQQLPGNGLLVADYVTPNMAAKLRQHGVQFIDTAGNAYINQPPVYVYATANRQPGVPGRPATKAGVAAGGQTAFRGLAMVTQATHAGAKRAFERTGLKVIYAFLCVPELVNAPYREIAEKAGVALGTVGWVINGLKDAGLLIDKGKTQGRKIANYRKLLDRWVEAWPEKLKPKYLLGEFVADDPYWWQHIEIGDFGGYWGGEVAAAKYTDYLKPKVATIYLPENQRNQLLRGARLRLATEWTGDAAGMVLLYRPFWPAALIDLYAKDNRELVHPILVYADLIATGDPRNLEVARRLYDDYIAGHNGKD
jgi:hypothetical protein